jgi:hypothetical protein
MHLLLEGLGKVKTIRGKNGQADSPHLDEEDDLTARTISDVPSLGVSFSVQCPVHKSGKVCCSHPDVF